MRITAEVDIAISKRFGAALAELDQEPAIVVDFRDCRYIDSTCLGVLVRRHKVNPMVLVVQSTGMVRKVMDLTGLTLVFPITETEADALTIAEKFVSSGRESPTSKERA